MKQSICVPEQRTVTNPDPEGDQLLDVRQRDVRVVSTLVTAALAGGMALLWPSVQERVVARFGPFFPSRFLLGELLVLVALYLAHVWRKAGRIERLIQQLLSERDRGRVLEERLAQARVVLQASAQLQLDDDAGESLRRILQCVTEALQAQRGVLWRQRGDGRPPEREAVFPSAKSAPDPLALAFEDEVARKVLASGETLRIDDQTDLSHLGIDAARPRGGAARYVAAPLVLERKPVGVLLLCDPCSAETEGRSPLELLEVFAGFAAGVLRNLRLFQAIARRNDELLRARQLLCDHQRELAEIDAVATMSRVARSLAHGLADPLTAISGFVDVALTSSGDSLTLKSAREGLRRETAELKRRLHSVVEFTETWRREYGLVDVNQVVETAVALQSEPLRTRGITCRFEPHAGLPYTVADATRLRQAILSLLTFLRDAVREGPGRELRLRTLAEGDKLRLHCDFPGRPDLAQFCAPLLATHVDIALLQREHHVELPVAVAIVREHRGDVTLELREDGTTRLAVVLPVLDRAPSVGAAHPPSEESFDEVLSRLCGEPLATRVALKVAENAATTPAMAARPVAAAMLAARAPPFAAVEPMVEAPRPSQVIAPEPSGPANAGLDGLFAPGEMFQGGPPKIARRRDSTPRRGVQQAELDDVLSLFDREEKPPVAK
ncbi:MAG: GAF domain-containing sensor histidine kinase [Planctomycetes bacterium]|nr:GAF domain-containing sensor histidine kinase [Planctomycetota bacterium]